jgi:hypothetical protein
VLASTKDAGLSYYAHLFTADVMLSLDRAEDARAAYEHALDLFPSSQAAHLGLGAALRMMGDRTGALAAVLEKRATCRRTRATSRTSPGGNYYDGDEIDVDVPARPAAGVGEVKIVASTSLIVMASATVATQTVFRPASKAFAVDVL